MNLSRNDLKEDLLHKKKKMKFLKNFYILNFQFFINFKINPIQKNFKKKKIKI